MLLCWELVRERLQEISLDFKKALETLTMGKHGMSEDSHQPLFCDAGLGRELSIRDRAFERYKAWDVVDAYHMEGERFASLLLGQQF